jgi:N-acylneuraminate cytidylyltransferase/CMP-N,N'-diacetyllegionaminic acid synthase
MNKICTICARAGSKGVKNKNVRQLLGKPLIAHTILQAKSAGIFNAIAVSSDSEEILEISKQWGVNYLVMRPSKLASDNAAKIPAIQHCVQEVELLTGMYFDTIVDLDATSPLRDVSDIIGAVHLLEETSVSNVITGTPAHRSPYFNLVELDNNGVACLSKSLKQPVVRRQDAPICYDMNASIYVWNRSAFFQSNTIFNPDTLLFEMPQARSIDIDSELDFEMVEFLMSTKQGKQKTLKRNIRVI